MSLELISLIVMILLAVLVPTFGYLLSRKDKQQEDKIIAQATLITDLYNKHEKVRDSHTELALTVAKKHYDKPEIDNLFTGFRQYLDERFTRLENFINKQEHNK